MEELLFGVLLALQELDVVDEQDVKVAVAVLELLGAGRAEGTDELIGEALGRGVADAERRRIGSQIVGDRTEQVSLAEPWGSVEKERVIGLRGRLGDGEGRSVGQPVALSDHETVECVIGVELDRRVVARIPGCHLL